MTPFRWILLNAVLYSFAAGLLYSYPSAKAVSEVPKSERVSLPTDDPNMPPVEFVDDGKVYDKPSTQPADKEFPKPPPFELFKVGERITCIYNGIFSWSDGQEFIKAIAMDCKVVNASEGWDDDLFGDNYQHIEVDCSKGLERKWSSQPGVGMVKNHKLNFRKRWFTSRECYHFVTED